MFAVLFARHRQRVFQLAHQLTGNVALADDVVQETFLQVYRDLPAFRGDAQLGTWLYRITMRTALRARARAKAHESSGELEADGAAQLRDAAHPNEALEARDRMRRVQAAMARLPIEQRAVVALFAVEGFGHVEIAAILGIPEGTVWSRLHQARKALAAALA